MPGAIEFVGFSPGLTYINVDGARAARWSMATPVIGAIARRMKVAGQVTMAPVYQVSFFKKLTDSTGHPSAPCQGVIEVQAASEQQAAQLARAEFAFERNIRDWSLHADYITLQRISKRKTGSDRL